MIMLGNVKPKLDTSIPPPTKSRTLDWPDGPLLGFDLETTSSDPKEALPVSFALVNYEDGALVNSTYHLVNPGVSIPQDSTAIHHITDEMVQAEGMPLDVAIDCCREILCGASTSGVPVVGMVLKYDLTIIDRLHRSRGKPGLQAPSWTGPALDVSILDRRLDKWRKGRRTLYDLCNFYGVEIESESVHNAKGDAIAAVEVLLAEVRSFPILRHTDLTTLTKRQAEIHRSFLIDLNEHRLRSGGIPIPDSEIDGDWPVTNCNISRDCDDRIADGIHSGFTASSR